MSRVRRSFASVLSLARSVVVAAVPVATLHPPVMAESVIPYLHSVRPTDATVALIHPVTGTSPGGASGSIRYAVGDVLSFRIALATASNASSRGMGGYVTVYVPGNTEVVGARFLTAAGSTAAPDRGGIGARGWGPRGAEGYTAPLQEGGIAALYGDTGIFYSTDARTARNPSSQEISVFNGILMSPAPTGAGQIDGFLGATFPFAHNTWDWVQVRAFAVTGGALGNGTGNTPFGYGSAVAGPQSFYSYEATEVSPGVIQATGASGPWQRIASGGSEVGTGVPATQIGPATRSGVTTVAGWALSPSNPLPTTTNAVRFAVGELRMGEEEFAEISLRVLGSPLDPAIGADVLCVEAFGGDASSRREDGSDGGKDNPWRYYLASTASELLGLRLELDADRGLASTGDQVSFTLRARNLTLSSQTNVVLSLDLSESAAIAFVSATGGAAVAGDVVTWPAATLAPGATVTHTIVGQVTVGGSYSMSRANYTSNQAPAPGRTVRRFIATEQVAHPTLDFSLSPAIAAPNDTVTVMVTIDNDGTGVIAGTGCAGGCLAIATLSAGFTYVTGTTMVNGIAAANPTVSGSTLRFTSGLPSVPVGGSATIAFDLATPPSPGWYPIAFETWLRDSGQGRNIEDEAYGSVPIALVSGVAAQPEGEALRLEPPAPNPFRGTTRIAFRLPRATDVRLTVHDATGRLVGLLARGPRAAGSHLVPWDGTDGAGRTLPSGIYFVHLETPGVRQTQKMLLMR